MDPLFQITQDFATGFVDRIIYAIVFFMGAIVLFPKKPKLANLLIHRHPALAIVFVIAGSIYGWQWISFHSNAAAAGFLAFDLSKYATDYLIKQGNMWDEFRKTNKGKINGKSERKPEPKKFKTVVTRRRKQSPKSA